MAVQELFQLVPDVASGEELMNGLQEGLRGRNISELPEGLVKAIKPYQATGEGKYSLALRQRVAGTFEEVLKVVKAQDADLNERLSYIRILGEVTYLDAIPVLLEILKRPPLEESKAVKITILNMLQRFDQPLIGERVLSVYPWVLREDSEVRLAALNLIVSRAKWTKLLLKEIEGTWVINKEDVPLELVRKMLLFDDESLNERVHLIWPATLNSSSEEKTNKINAFADVIKAQLGNSAQGKLVFQSNCGTCHHLKEEEGGNIGPDLTGYDRSDLSYMLMQIVDPSADIREGYLNYLIQTSDGRTLSGFLTERTDNGVTLQPYGSEPIQLSTEKIKSMEAQKTSLMPEGILERLSDQEVRDLFAFLTLK